MNINWIWYLGLGYLLGSIPFALVIGKLFYKTDVRKFLEAAIWAAPMQGTCVRKKKPEFQSLSVM